MTTRSNISSRNGRRKTNRGKSTHNARRKKQSINNHTSGMYDITQVKNVPISSRVIRYQSPSTQTDFPFTTTDFLRMIMYSTTTTEAFSLISAFKLKRVKVTLMPDASDVSGSCVFTWLGAFAPNNEYTTVFMNSVPATMNYYPLEGSVAAWWITATTDAQAIFEINLSTAIPFFLDIEFDWTLPYNNDETTTLTISGGTAERIVYPSLPRSLGSGRLVPVGLPTVV